MADETPAAEAGFEFRGEFYPWKFSDNNKDMLLIEQIGGYTPGEFIEEADAVEAEVKAAAADGREPAEPRTSFLLSLMATSIRARNPQWTVQRILNLIANANVSDFEIIGGEEGQEGEQSDPPAVMPPVSGEASTSTSVDSSPASPQVIPEANGKSSATSSETQVVFTRPG